jgi:ABC-type multidrug transport system ATPase subunit
LSELGENSVVLLSTHIVDDVSELCTRMAIIDEGEIFLEAEPLRAVAELKDRIWRRVISKAELPEVKFWGIFRFEFTHQIRRAWRWLIFVVVGGMIVECGAFFPASPPLAS